MTNTELLPIREQLERIEKKLDGKYTNKYLSINQPKEVRECTVISCHIYPYRYGRRPDKTTVDTLKRFYGENVEPTKGF
jgi:hypothetical protein